MIKDVAYVATLDQIPFICVSMLSFKYYHDESSLNFHFVYISNDREIKLLSALVEFCRKNNIPLVLHDLKESFESDIEVCAIAHMPPHLWRLVLPSILNVPSVLYLDSDTLINRNLNSLLDIDFEGSSIAARLDFAKDFSIFLAYAIGDKYSSSDPYLNSGVIAWDLEQSRHNDDVRRFLETALLHWKSCFRYPYPQPDQIVLNLVFHKKWKLLNPSYNAFIREPEMVEGHILHFIGNTKPWSRRTPVDLSFRYWQMLIQTPFPMWRFGSFMKRFLQPGLLP